MRDTLRWAAREPRVWLSVGAFALVSALAIQDGGAHWVRFGGAAAVLTALSVWWAYQAEFPPEVRAERERARFAEQVSEIIRAHEAQRTAGPQLPEGAVAGVVAGWPDVAPLGERLDRIAELLDRQQRQLDDLAAAVARRPDDDGDGATGAVGADEAGGAEPAGAEVRAGADLDAVRAEVAALRERLDGVVRELRTDSAVSLRALSDHIDATVLTLAEALVWPRGGGSGEVVARFEGGATATASTDSTASRSAGSGSAAPGGAPRAAVTPADVARAPRPAPAAPGAAGHGGPDGASGTPGTPASGDGVRRRKRTRRRG